MTRQMPTASSLFIILSLAACQPAPVGPRAVPEPPPEPPPIDAGRSPPPEMPDGGVGLTAMTDAGPGGAVDSGTQRPKLPAPDARAAEAGADAPSIDAGDDATPPVDAGRDEAMPVDAGGGAADDAAAARPPLAGEIVIVEALVNPGGQDAGREWIEVLNLSAAPLDLSGLHLADAAVDVAAPAGLIPGGGRVVLGQSADTSKNGGAPIAIAYGSRLALNNDGEEIAICVGPCADGMVVDRVGWKGLGAGYDGHAVIFDRGADRTCPATLPFGTAGDFGTPGGPDEGCPAPDAGF
jgi:hypothetical protein